MREHNAAGIALCPALDTPASLAQDLQSWGIPLVVMIRTLGEEATTSQAPTTPTA
ncbi:hypothetical protein ACHFCA_12590 [Delftia tsuruhatensis]